jgi:hypothetical protein
MRTIAGQIENFSFQSVSQGVNDPTLGNNVEAIFEAKWQQQIEAWQAMDPYTIINTAQTQAGNFNGNEHLGAVLAVSSTLPDIQQDIAILRGEVFTFQYSMDATVAKILGRWYIATGQNGRVGTDGLPNKKGPIQLTTISLVSSGNTWTTTVNGIYHTPHDLPTVPFSIVLTESVSIFRATTRASFTLSFNSSQTVNANTKNLKAAIAAIEVLGFAAIANLTSSPGINPELASLFYSADDYVYKKLSQLQTISLPISPLADAVMVMPQRVQLPGTIDDLWFDYDTISTPQGQILTATAKAKDVPLALQGAVAVFSGRQVPVRLQRVAWAMISGESNVTLAYVSGVPGVSAPIKEAMPYLAIYSDELVNPTFSWSVVGLNGEALPSVEILHPNTNSIELVFNANGKGTPTGTIVLKLEMDDSQHLKDQSGHSPSASMHIAISHEFVTIKPVQGGILTALTVSSAG